MIFFSSSKESVKTREELYTTSEEVYFDASNFYNKSDLVFFKGLNAYGAFKYPVVKNLFNSESDIGVSQVALELNKIYFSKDEQIHKNNKKAAITHLTFLSSKLQYLDNEYTRYLFNKFISNLPQNEKINLVDFLINPIVFINILKEYDLLETIFNEFNPESDLFSFNIAVIRIKELIENTEKMEIELKNYFDAGGVVPFKMQAFLDDMITESPIERADLPGFFRSILFVAVETSASFVSTFVYTSFKEYPFAVQDKNSELLYKLANEVLRIYAPVPFIFRTVWKDTEYAGIKLKKGAMVILFVGAANMDPDYFEYPTEIKLDRTNKHLSFGGGAYSCIGRFASFRMAMNVLDYLTPYASKLSFVDDNATPFFQNSILKIPVNVIYHD